MTQQNKILERLKILDNRANRLFWMYYQTHHPKVLLLKNKVDNECEKLWNHYKNETREC